MSMLEIAGLIYTFSITFCASTGDAIVSISRLFIIFAAFLTFFKNKRVRRCNKTYFVWNAVFIIFCCLSYFWGASKNLVTTSVLSLIYIMVVNWLLLYCLYKRHDYLFSLMKTMVWAAILHGLRVYLRHGFDAYLTTRGGTGIENANILAYVTALGFIFAFVLCKYKRVENKSLYSLALALNGLFALLTASKKVFIYIGIFLIIYYVFKSKNPLKSARNIIIVVLALSGAIYLVLHVPLLYSLIGNRIQTMILGLQGGETDGSTSFRLNLIRWGIEWFSAKPLIGYGLNCYKYLLGTSYNTWAGTSGVYAHNNYIELLVDVGIIGTVLYYFIYLKTLQRSFKLRKSNAGITLVSFALIITLLISEFGQVSYSSAYLQEVLLMVWFLACEYNLPSLN